MSNRASGSQHVDAASHLWLAKLRQARFTRLFVALFLLLFLSPFIGTFGHQLNRTVVALLVSGLIAIVLLAAALAVSDDGRHSRVAMVLAAACLILTLLGHLFESRTLRIVQYVATICFLTHIVRVIVRALFRLKRVDYDTIAASLCGYLLIGVVFAFVFSLVIEIDNNAITISHAGEVSGVGVHFGDRTTATALYFSFVTLTTLGYGDIIPASMPAQMLTTTEALIGQLYLVVLVARLVGIHISSESIRP